MSRVLMTADAIGGVWTYAVELAHALAPHGVEVHLATMGRRLSGDQRAEAGVFASVHESDLALEWMPDPWREVDAAGDWLLELAAELDPDVVHLNGYVHGSLPWPAPVVVVGHSCVVSWWEAVHGEEPPEDYAEYRRRVAAGLAAADAVVAPTQAMLEALRRHHGVQQGSVVPNCRRPDLLPVLPKEPLVLAAGRVWDAAKNLRTLAAVSPRVAWPVLVAGDAEGEEGPYLGPLPWPVLARWLARASVFAAPSSYEPFGLSPLEAAQAGCALVLGDVPSLREVWGDAATYADPHDPDALVRALNRLVEDPQERQLLAQRARRRASELSPQRTAAGYLEVYAALPGRVAA